MSEELVIFMLTTETYVFQGISYAERIKKLTVKDRTRKARIIRKKRASQTTTSDVCNAKNI